MQRKPCKADISFVSQTSTTTHSALVFTSLANIKTFPDYEFIDFLDFERKWSLRDAEHRDYLYR